MNATKGYFSLVQYCPDFARQEAANVGVVLFCPERQFIRAQTSKTIGRIRRFFGEDGDGYLHLLGMMEALSSRLDVEQSEFKTLEDLQQFIAKMANKIILTQPKPMRVLDPQADLEALYLELVADPKKPLTVQAQIPLRKRLDAVLAENDVRRFIQRKIEVHVSTLKETLCVPYAFQNGRFNLIQPIEFKHQNEAGVKTAACKHAVEGLSLHRHRDAKFGDLQLIVVADFTAAPKDSEKMVACIFQESQVRLVMSDALPALKQEIVSHAKLAPVE
jgi:hypothetical protein